jgi:tetratricopeptide (TPR) repeat protein
MTGKANGMVNGRCQKANVSWRKTIFYLLFPFAISHLPIAMPLAVAAAPAGGYFTHGMDLYKAGRYSEAVESFEQAMKHKDNAHEAQDYIDRIRKETVERIRNKALTGVNKANWQTKYYFMNVVDNRVRVGISVQEVFDRDSTNFRPGALDALHDLAGIIAKAESARFDLELINEVNLDTPPDPTLTAQQLTALFSYLSLDARENLPRL